MRAQEYSFLRAPQSSFCLWHFFPFFGHFFWFECWNIHVDRWTPTLLRRHLCKDAYARAWGRREMKGLSPTCFQLSLLIFIASSDNDAELKFILVEITEANTNCISGVCSDSRIWLVSTFGKSALGVLLHLITGNHCVCWPKPLFLWWEHMPEKGRF